jgi:hypothetical protein
MTSYTFIEGKISESEEIVTTDRRRWRCLPRGSVGEIDWFLCFRPGRVGEMKNAGDVECFGGDPSLIGVPTRKDGRLPIKGTDPELNGAVESNVGVAWSSLIGADIYGFQGDPTKLTTGANDFFI